jgi:arginine repressor
MEKEKRQQKILSLIQARNVGTQQELAALLKRAGVEATQSSVSRDLVELGVVKRNGFYTVPPKTNGAAARGLLAIELATARTSRRSSARSRARTRSSSPSPTARRSARQ